MLTFLHRNLLNILYSFFLSLSLPLLSSIYTFEGQEFPVLYKGRYRPAEAYARLWLYEFYHASVLKKEDFKDFKTKTSSPLSFLWSLDSLGYIHYQNAPLFWIGSANLKTLLGLPLTNNRFSYQELQQALYYQPEKNQKMIERLAYYYFLQFSSNNPTFLHFELTSLLPGLWTQRHGNKLIISATPPHVPWQFLKPGKVLISDIQKQEKEEELEGKLVENWSALMASLKAFEQLQGFSLPIEKKFQSRLTELQTQKIPPKEIERILEQEYPLMQRLQNAGSLFKSLPSRYKEGEWFSLKALKVQTYQSSTQTLKEVGNFTLFPEEDFQAIRQAYFGLEKVHPEFNPDKFEEAKQRLSTALYQAYQSLAGKIIQEAYGKQLTYPSFSQLKIETLYVRYPWIPLLILLYGIGAGFLMISYQQKFLLGCFLANIVISIAILCHTGLLAARCYILARPPVSNMFETVIYVPWVAACTSLLFSSLRKQPLALLAACITSIILLVILQVTDLNQSLDQVQAVLDSQFWLIVHVLLVVGSYGIFILSAIMGHFYLIFFIIYYKQTSAMKQLSSMTLQAIHSGIILLITGTILGGIWAAESWGRFWDWDPKESWAFISICFYLIWIHAYRFHHIDSFGLAIGAVSGLIPISFTWYGVNYILGTGLHSYGFGSGGEYYYYTFLATECLFIIFTLGIYQYRTLISQAHHFPSKKS